MNKLLFSQLIPAGFVIHGIEDDAILARVQSGDTNLIRGEAGVEEVEEEEVEEEEWTPI